jgi:hypothetical protein
MKVKAAQQEFSYEIFLAYGLLHMKVKAAQQESSYELLFAFGPNILLKSED